jgi:hypothetical protein
VKTVHSGLTRGHNKNHETKQKNFSTNLIYSKTVQALKTKKLMIKIAQKMDFIFFKFQQKKQNE